MDDKTSKKVSEYFKFMQDSLLRQYGGKVKSPLQLSRDERNDFFTQVQKEWKAEKKKLKSTKKAEIKKASIDLLQEFKQLSKTVEVLQKFENNEMLTKKEQDALRDLESQLAKITRDWKEFKKKLDEEEET